MGEKLKQFFNLGFSDENISKYDLSLAEENLKALTKQAFVGGLFWGIGMCALNLIHGASIATAMAFLMYIVMFFVIRFAAGKVLKNEKKWIMGTHVLIVLYALNWYSLAVCSDLFTQKIDYSGLMCFSFLVLVCMFDNHPVDSLCVAALAVVAIAVSKVPWMSSSYIVTDMIFCGISIVLGITISWNKSRSKIAQLRYIGSYKAMGIVYERAYYVNLVTRKSVAVQGFGTVYEKSKQISDAEEIKRMIAENYVLPEDRQRYLDFTDFNTVEERLAGGDKIEMQYKNQKGAWHKICIFAESRDQGTGRLNAVVFLVRNIDEQKRKELAYEEKLHETTEEALRANSSKTDFLRRISHDIRTPINGIRGMVEIGNHFPEDMEKQAECREKISSASGFLLDLVNDVLDMSKLESGEIILENQPFDLRELIDSICNVTETQALEHGLTFSKNEIMLEHDHLVGSPVHIRQILVNLISNAVKYNRNHGFVCFSYEELVGKMETDQTVVRFVCQDTGIGMSEEFQTQMFEAFTRENNETAIKGTGLGLSIVKKLVDKMHGEIQVQSAKGVGTTITVELPLKICAVTEADAEKTEEKQWSVNGQKILVVEDNDLNMEIAEFILSSEGAQVVKAWNGREAVDIFEKSDPGEYDVILMDLMMPIMGGLTATKVIRGMERSDAKEIPIIAMTANAFSDDIEHCKESGMNAHVAKPIDTALLIRTIAECVEERKTLYKNMDFS